MRTILVSAYACEPIKGSEPAVGWNWVIQLAQKNIVHVITRINNQEPIENNLPKDLITNIFFHYYDSPMFIRRLKRGDKGLYFYNLCWQIGIVPLAKKITKQYNINYTIHLTFGSMWMPTFLPLLKIPFIWGPIGGGECVPCSFIQILPWKQKIIQLLRYCLNATTIINPLILLPSWKAKVILVRTPNTQKAIPFFFKKKTRVLLETAMDEQIFARKKKDNNSDVVNMIISARLISIKNIPIVIRSLKYINTDEKWQLTIIGSGPDLHIINEEIRKYHYTNVKIIPFMPREESLEQIESSDIFIFPSLKEGGSWALMEAMAIGIPVICLNWAGMAVETDEKSAIQLPVTNPKQMEKDMGEAINRLINSLELRIKMGIAGRKRIKEIFNWDAKGVFMEKLFSELDNDK